MNNNTENNEPSHGQVSDSTQRTCYAFPQPANSSDPSWAGAQVGGMELRDWFAGMALQGLIANEGFATVNNGEDSMAEKAYIMADGMMERRTLSA